MRVVLSRRLPIMHRSCTCVYTCSPFDLCAPPLRAFTPHAVRYRLDFAWYAHRQRRKETPGFMKKAYRRHFGKKRKDVVFCILRTATSPAARSCAPAFYLPPPAGSSSSASFQNCCSFLQALRTHTTLSARFTIHTLQILRFSFYRARCFRSRPLPPFSPHGFSPRIHASAFTTSRFYSAVWAVPLAPVLRWSHLTARRCAAPLASAARFSFLAVHIVPPRYAWFCRAPASGPRRFHAYRAGWDAMPRAEQRRRLTAGLAVCVLWVRCVVISYAHRTRTHFSFSHHHRASFRARCRCSAAPRRTAYAVRTRTYKTSVAHRA